MAKFIITCDEATTICDKSQYGEATFFGKIKLNVHFLLCKICGLYSKQNTEMSKVYKMKAMDCKEKKQCMSSEEKETLKKKLQEIAAE
jgi:hypothetical protein